MELSRVPADHAPVIAQPVAGALTATAIFLVARIGPTNEHQQTVRSFCGDLSKLVHAVGFRHLQGGLS